ncbi:hypothetical protein [Methanothermobacter tenebrarum]|uniref:hypothetical protein n=1 Tax=Methanothermobacter tenebrarum TaxID=680118 RepID=UPI0015EC3487|nr:hypothetical protein [Methanothermobacter tenebrarum]NPV64763.1 hypothetical protein [Methanobacteriaceae archaeon]
MIQETFQSREKLFAVLYLSLILKILFMNLPSNPQHNKLDPELPESIRSKFGDSIPSELWAPPTFDNNTKNTILYGGKRLCR